jgi:hypothetical protein
MSVARQSDRIPSKEYVPQAREAVTVLNQIGGRKRVLLAPEPSDDACFEETVDATKSERPRRPFGVGEDPRFSLNSSE